MCTAVVLPRKMMPSFGLCFLLFFLPCDFNSPRLFFSRLLSFAWTFYCVEPYIIIMCVCFYLESHFYFSVLCQLTCCSLRSFHWGYLRKCQVFFHRHKLDSSRMMKLHFNYYLNWSVAFFFKNRLAPKTPFAMTNMCEWFMPICKDKLIYLNI